jgi:hypothetical protein
LIIKSAICEPIKPAPPVSTTFITTSFYLNEQYEKILMQ